MSKPNELPSADETNEETISLNALRERQRIASLSFWTGLAQQPKAADIVMYGGTKVSGVLRGGTVTRGEPDDVFMVDELATPLGTYPAANMRASDVRYVVIK
ncbi:uncharacterized protein EV422DRAFT_570644 [Fimicolochytrium jonesii]|uniref:uncharacterized protein n=1 Tax=Fimicolochytrium jonesii TaxID=1396493 RepID=UPI0022FE1D0E|nr:uncharacterized protein EV422DRAFT_570644 [Fimicolochytrium jonesii]KAI8817601.1 hypothetical protein EV422DRAFT_570644 [Fimicolochytrium jonesii]